MISDRELPFSQESEIAVLGAILLDNKSYFEAASILSAEDFYVDSHKQIFACICDLSDSGRPVDFTTLTNELGSHGSIERVGGASYVIGLTDGLPRVKNIAHYAKTIAEKSSLRKLINLATSAACSAYENERSEEIIGGLADALLQIAANSHKGQAVRISDFSEDTLSRLVARRASESRLVGFSTGLQGLDFKTTGIREKEFWIIGGRTGDGKTSLALQMAQANAEKGIPVCYFSLEMDKDSLLERLWSSFGKIDFKHIRIPKLLEDPECVRLTQAKMQVDEWPLFIEEAQSYTISEIVARSRLLIRQHGIKLIIVDYMQIVDAVGKDERHRLTKISKSLRQLAKGENVAVVGISQMPRPQNHDMNKRPTKFDLKESGALENDANTILLLYRPVDEFDQYLGTDEIIVAKQRSGETGIEPVVYLGLNMRFEERY